MRVELTKKNSEITHLQDKLYGEQTLLFPLQTVNFRFQFKILFIAHLLYLLICILTDLSGSVSEQKSEIKQKIEEIGDLKTSFLDEKDRLSVHHKQELSTLFKKNEETIIEIEERNTTELGLLRELFATEKDEIVKHNETLADGLIDVERKIKGRDSEIASLNNQVLKVHARRSIDLISSNK